MAVVLDPASKESAKKVLQTERKVYEEDKGNMDKLKDLALLLEFAMARIDADNYNNYYDEAR